MNLRAYATPKTPKTPGTFWDPWTQSWLSSLAETSILKNVPIRLLTDFQAHVRSGINNPNRTKYRVLFRGPRQVALGDTRSAYSRQSGCLKRFATTFAVYRDRRRPRAVQS